MNGRLGQRPVQPVFLLNQYYATFSVLVATGIGLMANSWLVFAVAAGILLALNLFGGNIRLGGGGLRRHPPRRRRFRSRRFA